MIGVIFDSMRIAKLRQMNAKLVKEMKLLAAKLDATVGKNRHKPKPLLDENTKGSTLSHNG